jgi:hypothetical protein
MEILTILLSSLIGLISPVGFITDTLAEQAIRDRLESVEQLEVRIDNGPSYQLLQGRVNRVRIAGQGLFPIDDLRIETLQVETDAIDINVDRLQAGELVLDQPLNFGVRVILRREDLNQLLRSPYVTEVLQDFNLSLADDIDNLQGDSDVTETQIDLLDDNRIRIQVDFRDTQSTDQLTLVAETGLIPQDGSQIQFADPVFIANEDVFTTELEPLLQAISQGLDLRNLDDSGITARILQLKVDPIRDEIVLAALVHLDPSVDLSGD